MNTQLLAILVIISLIPVSPFPPPSLDWRQRGAVTLVKNQGACACCWAFSTVVAIEGVAQILTGNLVSFSEQQVVDCAGNTNACEGGFLDVALEYATHGMTSTQQYSYKAAQENCTARETQSFLTVNLTGYAFVPANNETEMLLAVARQPVAVKIDPIRLNSYKSGVITGECGNNLTHAVTIVGYNTTEEGLQYWIVKNSWGTEFGERGYARLQRNIGNPEGMCGIASYAVYPTAVASDCIRIPNGIVSNGLVLLIMSIYLVLGLDRPVPYISGP